jgi:predicted metal-dependent hydrolase
MRSVQYGSKQIDYSILEKEGLKSHYISVEKHAGVVLKGKPVSGHTADRLILKKAGWILNKLDIVKANHEDQIVTGSRIQYLGKSYYVQVVVDSSVKAVAVEFTYSKFKITVKSASVVQEDIQSAIRKFYKEKAVEKLTPRIQKLSEKTGIPYRNVQFRNMNRRWGSCTASNQIILNTEAVKLPYSLIDYLVVHELVHTRIKNHSSAFWAELSKHVRNWRLLDKRMAEMKM